MLARQQQHRLEHRVDVNAVRRADVALPVAALVKLTLSSYRGWSSGPEVCSPESCSPDPIQTLRPG